MNRLKKERTPLRIQFTRIRTSVTALLQAEVLDKPELQVKFENLEDIYGNITELDDKIKPLMLDQENDEAVIQTEYDNVEKYYEDYLRLKYAMMEVLKPEAEAKRQSEGNAHNLDRKRKFKLPEVQLMKFDGDLKNWQSWWSQFRKIHELTPEEMDPSDKFQYLISAIKEGSKAHEIVSSYLQNADNYPEAIAALKESFGRDDLQLQVYVRELLSLVISNVTKKEKMSLSTLQLKLQSHLRCLATLKINNADPSTWLFPLVESSLSEDTIRAWQRNELSRTDGSKLNPPKNRLELLMDFITGEVRSEQQIALAQTAFQDVSMSDNSQAKGKANKATAARKGQEVTAAGLVAGQVSCIFCDGRHESDRCIKAQSMTAEEKSEKVKEHKRCFYCLLHFHGKGGKCKIPLKCIICGGSHQSIMCRGGKTGNKQEKKSRQRKESSSDDENSKEKPVIVDKSAIASSSTSVCSNDVLLNIIQVKVTGDKGSTTVRLMGDTGSSLSYIRQDVVKRIGLKKIGGKLVQNVLFGGATSQLEYTEQYRVGISNLKGKNTSELELFSKRQICGAMHRTPQGPWIEELQDKGIQLTDVGTGSADIDIIIGSDYWGDILTGKMLKLKCGLLAIETVFGWTISGRVPVSSSNMAVVVTNSLLSVSNDISHLWSLEAIGIKDPIEVQSKEEEERQALQHFRENVQNDDDGRYIVALPWKVSSSSLPTNRFVAEKRLQRAVQQLQKQDKFGAYDEVFRGWEKEGIIKEVDGQLDEGHFLPHRPVFKESLTTPVRPVFDASCKIGRHPSLNDCLYKGPNLLELIPTLLLRFRENEYGVSADIRKAFQMVSVREEDQKFQKFLWWKDTTCKELKVYQHRRVVFGLNCSPFLLAATIQHHLMSLKEEIPYAESRWLSRLLISFYVDNLVSSVQAIRDYNQLRSESTAILKKCGMELRQWARNLAEEPGAGPSTDEGCRLELGEITTSDETEMTISLLGLVWNREADSMSCVIPEVDNDVQFTKKMVLSLVARIFDPIGFLSPALIPLKEVIQESWAADLGWDDVLPDEAQKKTHKWIKTILQLQQIKLPRHFQLSNAKDREVHVFVDASSTAYAGVVYMRSSTEDKVMVQLLLAKSRLAPKRKTKKSEGLPNPTIPRLELMACVIGTRLLLLVREALNLEGVPVIFWSDSTTALAWIRRHDHWGAFVGNRVDEIRKTTTIAQWRHVPGVHNPADLPSRGCNPNELLKSTWWEGPDWLKEDRSSWPTSEDVEPDEEVVQAEAQKTSAMTVTVKEVKLRFSSYRKNLAVWGWIIRFIDNARKPNSDRIKLPYLRIPEIRRAEKHILREVQEAAFPDTPTKVGGIAVSLGQDGLLRVTTRLLNREDSPEFKNPIILPNSHPLVELLIMNIHKTYKHAGIQILMSVIREKYWILQTRRTIRRVLRKCVICRRHQAKPLEVVPGALPSRRVDDCDPFQTTGVDLFGPLFLKDGSKVWVVLFTCAFYRGIYLDPVTSLDTEAFLGALERFIALYGRPNTIYSDNGTNFHGAVNVFKQLDWKSIEEKSNVRQIQWIFNPPTAAWWGGMWERLIRSVKDLLKRVLGKSKLDYDLLRTCLAGVCSTINDRPLTVVTEDNDDLIPLTPAMFMKRHIPSSFPESANAASLQKNYLKMKTLQQQLQERFRKEYLSLLVQRGNQPKRDGVSEGAVVLVGADNRKRFQWTLGIIWELMYGPDGEARRAKVHTQHGLLERPLQRLYPLEINCVDVEELKTIYKKKEKPASSKKASRQPEVQVPVQRVIVTKRGRVIRTPARYGQWPN